MGILRREEAKIRTFVRWSENGENEDSALVRVIIAKTGAYMGLTRVYLQDFNIKTSKKMNANFVSKLAFRGGASGRTRTYNPSVNRCDPSFFLWQKFKFFLLYMCDDFEDEWSKGLWPVCGRKCGQFSATSPFEKAWIYARWAWPHFAYDYTVWPFDHLPH